MVKISGVFTPVMVLRAVLKKHAYISPGVFWSRSRGMSNTFLPTKYQMFTNCLHNSTPNLSYFNSKYM